MATVQKKSIELNVSRERQNFQSCFFPKQVNSQIVKQVFASSHYKLQYRSIVECRVVHHHLSYKQLWQRSRHITMQMYCYMLDRMWLLKGLVFLLTWRNCHTIRSSSNDNCVLSEDLSPAMTAILCAVERRIWTIPMTSPAVSNSGCLLGSSR